MLDIHTYLLFVGAVLVLVAAPGPDMAYLLARTIAQGRRAGTVAAIGLNAGAYVHVTAVVFGLSAILTESSAAFTVVKWVGACYLMWIGARAIFSKSGPLRIASSGTKHMAARTIFWQGFLSDVLNPKVAVFFLALLPQFVDIHNPDVTVTGQLIVLGVTCNMIAVTINLALVYFAGAATAKLRKNQRIVAWLHKAMGAIFVSLGVRLAQERL